MVANKNVDYFVTEKGSVYRNLEGTGRGQRYQRFKTVENKQYDPWNLTVFIPTLSELGKMNPIWNERFISDSELFDTVENLAYSKTIAAYVGDENRKPLINNHHVYETMLGGGNAFMILFDMNKKTEKRIPVSMHPELGYVPFETTVIEKNGARIPNIHLGHKIVKIVER